MIVTIQLDNHMENGHVTHILNPSLCSFLLLCVQMSTLQQELKTIEDQLSILQMTQTTE